MKIIIAADHTAAALMEELRGHLTGRGFSVITPADVPAPAEYPEQATAAAREIIEGRAELGILLCGTGAGVCIAANKIPGIRAAVCNEPYTAQMTRVHNHAHILCLGARVVGTESAKIIVDAFVSAKPEGGRHEERVKRIMALEQNK